MKETARNEDRRMTVKAIAEHPGCTVRVVRKHIERCFPGLMRHGKTTYVTEAHLTVILESMKNSNESFQNRTGNAGVASAETGRTDEFRLALLYKQDAELMKEAAALERALRLKAETELREAERRLGSEVIARDRTKNGLSMYRRIAESAGPAKSYREDTYRRMR
jgi:hypothetical protein